MHDGNETGVDRPARGIGYDVLVLDLDGTMLGPGGEVPRENVEAVGRAQAAGIEIIIATGRALAESIAVIEALEHAGHAITAGGSMMSDVTTGHTVERRILQTEIVHHVTMSLVEHGHRVLLLKDAHAAGYDYLAIGTADLDPATEWWFESLPVEVRYAEHAHEDAHPDDTVRAGVVADGAVLAPIARALEAEVGDRAFLQHWSAVTASEVIGGDTHLLEIFGHGVNKWTMVAAYCADRGIDPRRVAAIGDGLNDVELLRDAGLGIAMGNADPRARAVADRVTGDNRSGGAAQAIDRILDGVW